jgi:hypothetical protein
MSGLCGFGRLPDWRISTLCHRGRVIIDSDANLGVPSGTFDNMIKLEPGGIGVFEDATLISLANSTITFANSTISDVGNLTVDFLIGNICAPKILADVLAQKDLAGIRVQGDLIIEDDLVLLGNINMGDNITSDTMCANTMQTNILEPKVGSSITLNGSLNITDTLTVETLIANNLSNTVVTTISGNLITANILCANTKVLTDILQSKSGGPVTILNDTVIDGTLTVDTLTANSISNINIQVSGDIVNANIFCANVKVQTDLIEPKTGSTVVIDGDGIVTGTLTVDTIFANNLSNVQISTDTVTANVVCANVKIQADLIESKTGNGIVIADTIEIQGNATVSGTLIVDTIQANNLTDITSELVTANVICANIKVQTDLIESKNGGVITISDPVVINANTTVNGEFTADTITANVIEANIITNITTTVITTEVVNSNVVCANTMQTNTIESKTGNAITVTDPVTLLGNVTIETSLTVDTIYADTIQSNSQSNVTTTIVTAETVIANVLCGDMILIDTIEAKTGNIIVLNDNFVINGNTTVNGTLVVDTIQANTITNVEITTLTTENVTANVVCANVNVQTNEIVPKSGNTLSLSSATFVTANIFQASCIDYKRTIVTSNAYAIKSDDDIIAVLSNTFVTITLPEITTLVNNRKRYVITDEKGDACINNIKISPSGSDKIVGGDFMLIQGNYMSISIYSDEIDNWFIF